MKTIDLNIGLEIEGKPHALDVRLADVELTKLGLIPIKSRLAHSSTEATYVVRCSIDDTHLQSLSERVYQLAVALRQDAIAAVPHDGGPAICVGPGAHRWGGAFLPQHWISLA
jgi:hypothetical protein